VALGAGTHVIAQDLSSAVDAAAANLRQPERFGVVQGDIDALPFAPASFDAVYSPGVLQHTPDAERAFGGLPGRVNPRGTRVVDFYGKSRKRAPLPQYRRSLADDHPQTPQTAGRWLQSAGLQRTEVLHADHLVGRGRRP
jgi:ubiquinone/menaquinone biosynthesis C-methylase UbiE